MTSVSMDLDRKDKEGLQKLIMQYTIFQMFDSDIDPTNIPSTATTIIDSHD
jgi:hypothetical protein